MASGHGSVDEVRDNVSERADLPEVVEVIPQPQSFADAADFIDHVGHDHELSDWEVRLVKGG